MITRVIPKIDIKANSVVKGINLEGLRALGDPSIFAKKYYEDGADEIIYHDVVASLYDQSTIFELISNTAEQIFVPLTVSGGIRSIDDIKKMLSLGADKVAINSQAIKDKNFIKSSAEVFGSSTIVVSIETMKVDQDFYIFYEYGRVNSGIKLLDWIEEIQSNGVGEILLTSITNEGTGSGFDTNLFEVVKNKIKVPFLFNGGCGKAADIYNLNDHELIDGFVISSLFHYDLIKNIKTLNDNIMGNFDYLKAEFFKQEEISLSIFDLKKELKKNKIQIR